MTLTLKITSYQSQTLGANSCKSFSKCGGSIGREQDNDWVLPDPERFISGRHTQITYQDSSYHLTDTSTNGIFVNGSSTPLGNGKSIVLHEGDHLSLGDYEIEVSIDNEAIARQIIPPSNYSPSPQVNKNNYDISSIPVGGVGNLDSLDPLANDRLPPDTSEVGADSDHVSSLAESFQLPGSKPEAIPDDWDFTGCVTPENFQPSSPLGGKMPGKPNQAQSMPTSGSENQADLEPAAPANQKASGNLSADFFRGIGIDPAGINSYENMESYGMLFREMVQGTMEVLVSRATLKSEFRMPLTTIRPVENNPLKFSPSVDDALNILFSSQGTGYLSPADSIRESFEDIKCHQMAMVAGIQAAFNYMLQCFDPESFQEQGAGGMLDKVPLNRNARNWERYRTYHETVTGDPEHGFQILFGEEFARAYEDQIRRLEALRKK